MSRSTILSKPSYRNEIITTEPARKIHDELYVDTGYDAIWRLSNAGFAVRLGDTYLFLDPVFTSPLKEYESRKRSFIESNGDTRRLEHRFYDKPENIYAEYYDSPLPPEHVEKANYILITHDHGDHFDPQGLAQISTLKPTIIAPKYLQSDILATGLTRETIIEASHGQTMDFEDFSVEVIPAEHGAYQRPDPGACGFLVKTRYGNIYHPGDGNFDHPGKETICNLEVDYLLAPINDTNLGVGFAALLTHLLQPKIVIPCHYGYTYPPVRSQGGHPAEFVTALATRNYKIPHTDIIILTPGGKVVLA